MCHCWILIFRVHSIDIGKLEQFLVFLPNHLLSQKEKLSRLNLPIKCGMKHQNKI